MEELNTFIESNPDPRELKRALAVRMTNGQACEPERVPAHS